MVNRLGYMHQLRLFRDKQLIKVVTGIRRCGKSTLLAMFQEELRTTGVMDNQIISINLEDLENKDLCNYMELYRYVKSKLVEGKMTYVFIDEVQNCKEYQRAIDSLFIQQNVDVYVTGSNAYMLSSELATLLTGRYITIDMLPLSFEEFASAHIAGDNKEIMFREYLRYGSFPQLLQFGGDQGLITKYLEALYTTVFKKDLVARNNVKDELVLEDVTKYIFDNIGNITSPKKISDTLTSNGRKITQPTVENYLTYLKDSYLVYQVNRYDIKGKQLLKTLSKYYVADMGIRNYLLGFKDTDRGHVLENVVFLELMRQGYRVNVGKIDSVEVDFVASRRADIIYIQVAETVRDRDVLQRELKPLQAVKDFHKRVLLSMDYDFNDNYDGIRHLNIMDFLLGKSKL